MNKDEDVISYTYKYSWKSGQEEISLEDFLAKYRPSMVQNDGTKPWIWVRRPDPNKDQDYTLSTLEAYDHLQAVTTKVESIKNDESIPLRSNKKTGAKSKKEVREQVQAEAAEKFKEIAIRHGDVSGKWLIFAPANQVDMIWRNIAMSLISGPLSETVAFCAKVATSPENQTPNYQHVICLYLPDVYDKDEVTKVMSVLLRKHGAVLSGVKSDLYTRIGIDSKHPSGIQSTIWKNTALMEDSKIKELRDAFFAELASNNDQTPKAAVSAPSVQQSTSDSNVAKPAKPKPKLKKKGANDPFASDEDDKEEEAKIVSNTTPSSTKDEAAARPLASHTSTNQKARKSPKGKERAGNVQPVTSHAGNESATEPDNLASESGGEDGLPPKPNTTKKSTGARTSRTREQGASIEEPVTGSKRSATKVDAKAPTSRTKRAKADEVINDGEEAESEAGEPKRTSATRKAPAKTTSKKTQQTSEEPDAAAEGQAREAQDEPKSQKHRIRGQTPQNAPEDPTTGTSPIENTPVETKPRRTTRRATPKPVSSGPSTNVAEGALMIPDNNAKESSEQPAEADDNEGGATEKEEGKTRGMKKTPTAKKSAASRVSRNTGKVDGQQDTNDTETAKPRRSARSTTSVAANKRGPSAAPEGDGEIEVQPVKKSRTTRK